MAVAYVGGVVTGVVGRRRAAGSRGSAGVIDEAADRIVAKAARPVDREALERAAVEGMLRALGDRWSTYYGTSEFTSFQSALEGHYSGVGLWLRGTPAGAAAAASRSAASSPARPAEQAGLLAGDVSCVRGAAPT